MLEMTRCAMPSIEACDQTGHKRLNDMEAIAADNDSNDSAINDMNVCTDGADSHPDGAKELTSLTDETQSTRHLVSDLSTDQTNHMICHCEGVPPKSETIINEVVIMCPAVEKTESETKSESETKTETKSETKTETKRKSDVPTQELHDLTRARARPQRIVLANPAKRPTTRSENGIHIKKPIKELPETTSAVPTPHLKKVQLNTSMKFCHEIIKELLSKKHRDYAWPFYEPVSTQHFPDYLDIVKKPIDLSTIKTRIETGQYKTVKPFVKDMRLMITNCLRYNKPEAPVIEQARRVRDFFEYQWARIPEELLKEKLTVSHSSNQKSKVNSESKKEKESTEESTVESSRMRLLETQVRLLTSTLTALTGINTKTIKPKNGQKKSNSKKVSNRVNNRRKQTNKRADADESEDESDPDDCDSDDEFDDSDDELVTSPSPVVFDVNNMEDLQQLKTDLENLDAKNLKNVLRILRQTEPSIKCDNDENIEIDFEALRPETLTNLRKFVSSCMLNNINIKRA